MIVSEALEQLTFQPRLKQFFEQVTATNCWSHAYLVTGSTRSVEHEVAYTLARLMVASQSEDLTAYIELETHPDIHILTPQGAQGYLVAQIREMIADVAHAPLRAGCKVYVIQDADILGIQAANALLKTLEEPPASTHLILTAPSRSNVLATIASRCQETVCTAVSQAEQLRYIQEQGISAVEARFALAVYESALEAGRLWNDPVRVDLRRLLTSCLTSLPEMPIHEVLAHAQILKARIQEACTAAQEDWESGREGIDEYLSKGAMKEAQASQKRTLTAFERTLTREVLLVLKTFLRDVLIRCENIAIEPQTTLADASVAWAQVSSVSSVQESLAAIDESLQFIESSVSTQLVLETCLLRIKEACICR